ncbi:MAG: hypothetical protein HS105_09565 [Chloracidobacterium sp.]|nr:hypothetical protein [Chloracidobacterium sp.]MCO5333290.1 hypothetical protein [Pyrinomonadaceae bacterium]
MIDELEHTIKQCIAKLEGDPNDRQKQAEIPFEDFVPVSPIVPHIIWMLVTHSVTLLELYLPTIIDENLTKRGIDVHNASSSCNSGDVLQRTKCILDQHGNREIKCDNQLHERLKALIRVRNDIVHNLGTRSKKTKDGHIETLPGIMLKGAASTFDISFYAVRYAIRDVEDYFVYVDKASQSSENS